jgi:quinol-cytochrome oxidoreductase complex cytochrome b subunit
MPAINLAAIEVTSGKAKEKKRKKRKEREKKEQEKEKNEDATSVSRCFGTKYARSIFFFFVFGFFLVFFFSPFSLSPSLSTLLKLLLYPPRSRPPSIVGPPRSRD